MKFLYNSINHSVFYTLESLIMAVVASNLLLVIIGVCLYSRKILKNTGYKILIIFLAVTLLRFVFPVELPFSRTLALPKISSDVLSLIHSPLIKTEKIKITIGHILSFIWISVGIFLLYKYFRDIKRSRVFLENNGKDITREEPFALLMEEICQLRKKKNNFRLIRTDAVNVPMVYGICKPYILIPENFEISREEWFYILNHEASHYFHHDLIVKFIINILTIIYWWNPVVHLFKKQAGLLLEMQVDDKVINGSRETAMKYLNCLLNVKEMISEKKDQCNNVISGIMSLTFVEGERTELERRFGMIVDSDKSRKKWVNMILIVATLTIYYLSYQFIFEANYSPYNIEEDVIQKSALLFPDTNEIYAIENIDGTYSIYCDYPTFRHDFFIEQVDDISERVLIENIYYLEKGRYKE